MPHGIVEGRRFSGENSRSTLTEPGLRAAILQKARPAWISSGDYEAAARLVAAAHDHSVFEPNLSHILAQHGVLDAWGHVSMRHPKNPQRYLISRARAPARRSLLPRWT